MNLKVIAFILLGISNAQAQLKFVIEDFEGFTSGGGDINKNGVFVYGNAKTTIVQDTTLTPRRLGERYITVWSPSVGHNSGWGKGIGLNVELDPASDFLNFYVHYPGEHFPTSFKITLQEDDNDSKQFEEDKDDTWLVKCNLKDKPLPGWQLVSIPLNKFTDSNKEGDGVFNCNYTEGKLLALLINFEKDVVPWKICFDLFCFSKGALNDIEPKTDTTEDFCALGLWSAEGNTANFSDIALAFKKVFANNSTKSPGVIHFFQPFSIDGGKTHNLQPLTSSINKIIEQGYIPMITLEDHFVNAETGHVNKNKQPDLNNIINGDFDFFFISWAKQLKQVKGPILLRILHEFNGNWYPWCVANNKKDPQLLVKAYRHIRTVFKTQGAHNVKFIWCPNSMSIPQEKWNFILDAYPGDEYVDLVGLDIYNGAGRESRIWRSFLKEGIEGYFLLTSNFPSKPFLVCETASRERNASEKKDTQSKAGWIEQMSFTLRSDMREVRLLSWFNEKDDFKLNSSIGAQNAFLHSILFNDHFKSGTEYLLKLTN